MNRNSQNREETFRGTVDEPIGEGQPLPRNGKYHNEESGPVIGFEERIKRGERVVSATKRLVIGIASLVSLVCVVTKVSISEVSEIAHRIKPAASSTSSLHPEPVRATEPVDAPSPDAIAINQSANNDAAAVIDSSEVSLDSRPVTKKKRKRDPRETEDAYAKTLPTESRAVAGPCSGQSLPQFTTRIGVPISFRCENGQWRVREGTSVASIPSTWGDAAAGRR